LTLASTLFTPSFVDARERRHWEQEYTHEAAYPTGRVRVVGIRVSGSPFAVWLLTHRSNGMAIPHPKCRADEAVDISVETERNREIDYSSINGTRNRRNATVTTDAHCRKD
jgi:hypothetical protein